MRSKLFVPGSRPELFAKAMASSADGISFDLEDAVAESAKGKARQHLAEFLGSQPESGKTIVVRINDLQSSHYLADLEALIGLPLHIINLPKVETPEQILQLVGDLERLECQRNLATKVQILANIESPKGLRRAAEIAAADPRVMGLQLGFADLLEPLGISRLEQDVIRQIQLTLRLAAGESGVAAYDGAFASVKDRDGYLQEAQYARSLGFAGKSCIHPSQIEMANQAFVPGEEEITQAQKVVAAAAQAQTDGVGAWLVDGKMIDAPFVSRARDILAQAHAAGLLAHPH
jgi:citrate lyase subunit beta/citryl-CoA lyase